MKRTKTWRLCLWIGKLHAWRRLQFFFFKHMFAMLFYSYDVVFTSNVKEIMAVFDKFNTQIVFSAERFCWPDRSFKVCFTVLMLSFNVLHEMRSVLITSFVTGVISCCGGKWKLLSEFGRVRWFCVAVVFCCQSRGLATKRRRPALLQQDLSRSAPARKTCSCQPSTSLPVLAPSFLHVFVVVAAKTGMVLDTRTEIFQNFNGALDDVQLKFMELELLVQHQDCFYFDSSSRKWSVSSFYVTSMAFKFHNITDASYSGCAISSYVQFSLIVLPLWFLFLLVL